MMNHLQMDSDDQISWIFIERDGKLVGIESVWLRKDRTHLSIRKNANAVKDADGNTVYYYGAVENITLHKEAEATNERLEAQLVQAQKVEAIGQLAGGVRTISIIYSALSSATPNCCN